MVNKTLWHVVQNVKTGHYHVVRYMPGQSDEEMEFLCGRSGFPRAFIGGELADSAADKANFPWKYSKAA